jgi:alpha-galactosidase
VEGGLNEATHRLHNYRRKLRPALDRPLPVQFNSWFPYQGEPPIEVMKEYATRASRLGCEIFVLDAGWYTTEQEDPDEDWWLKTGDWVVNRRLFPGGLEELSEHCRQQGIDFGIWMEPEAVGPNATIRRTRPEWLHAVGGRAPAAGERAILNLGVPEARAWIRERILDVLTVSKARWLKWDFNIDLLQGGWADGLPDEVTRQDPLVAHYRGVYTLQDELRAACPDLVLEMCSSGGSRFDGAILSHAHWISDQTHPLMKLAIHFGSQLANPPEQCNDWLVEWPPHEGQHDPLRTANAEEGDLAFRTGVAMLTGFGISAPVEQWSDEDSAAVARYVTWYKQVVRPVLPKCAQYLLTEAPPLDGNGDWAGVWYVLHEGNRGVLFAFRLANGKPACTFALPGLPREATYRLSSPDGWSATCTGAELVEGLTVEAPTPFRAVLLSVEQVGAS